MWHLAAALAPLPLIGLGYASIPGNQIAFRYELLTSGAGSEYAPTKLADAANLPIPLPRAAASLFRAEGKGPRADQFVGGGTPRHFVAASVAGSIDADTIGGKTDLLKTPATQVALRDPVRDNGVSSFLDSPAGALLQPALGNSNAPTAESIAYHPSPTGLSFKSKGESQAEFEERERRCLATAIYFEARGESMNGQIAVGQVILNRVRSPQFPETICGVVYQGQMAPGCQFSFACDGKTDIPRNDAQWAQAQSLARKITSGEVWLPDVGYSTYYHANYVRPQWVNDMSRIDTIGRHIFYKKRNEQPYVVQASSPGPAAVMALASASSDAPVTSNPTLSLGLGPSE